MYETEANQQRETAQQIPASVLEAFAHPEGSIVSRTVLPWGEHCTECVWPTCYTSCDLYTPRADGRCRRFADGMVRIDAASALNSYLLKIRFKRWGKLWTPGNLRLHTADKAAGLERRDYRVGSALVQLPLPSLVRTALTQKRYGFKKLKAVSAQPTSDLPHHFLLECYNPAAETVDLSLVMRAVDAEQKIPFQKLIPLVPGFNRVRIAMEEISAVLNLHQPFGIELIPNDDERETALYFGLMEFVRESTQAASGAMISTPKNHGREKEPKSERGKSNDNIKCVVWDLDNTLWDGVLVEDGFELLRLKPGIREVIEELDRRGILQSIASKNNFAEAMEALRKFKLEEYFLRPQISWEPKSQAIQTIAQQLNIGIDTLLFIDDSAFEREEVASAHAGLRVLDAARYLDLPGLEACQVPVTEESRERRKMYQVEAGRQEVAQNFSHDYLGFLRHSQIALTVRPMEEENLERVHELTQRTNQMNFSGNRYDREVLRKLLADENFDTFVLSCKDRFGSYGVVGFSVVDRREPRMTDLMFSCRIQSKRVEHAFMAWLIERYIRDTGKDFHADYRQTPRNAPSGKVFSDIGMEEETPSHRPEGVSSLKFSLGKSVPMDGVIAIDAPESAVRIPSAGSTEAMQETTV